MKKFFFALGCLLILGISPLAVNASTYERDPSVSVIPNGTSLTITVTGIDLSSTCSITENSWGIYIIPSGAVNPDTVYTSSSQSIVNQDLTWVFSGLPAQGYEEVGVLCYTGTASGIDSFVFWHNGFNRTPLEVGTPAFSITPLTITTPSLLDARVAVAFSQTLQAVDGTIPYTWSVVSGTLPMGLSLNSSTGEIFGTPTAEGLFNLTIQVTDATPWYAIREFNFRVLPEVIITPVSQLFGKVGYPFSLSFEVTGGTPAYMWSVDSGTLGDGMFLNSSTGEFYGTPSLEGTFDFVIRASDVDEKTATRSFRFVSINYLRSPSITAVPGDTSITITANGVNFQPTCSDPVGNSWGIYIMRTDAVNPGGVYPSPTQRIDNPNLTWTFENLPLGDYSEVGVKCYTFTASSPESLQWWNNGVVQWTLETAAPVFSLVPLTITTNSLADATVGRGYSKIIQTSNGTAPLSWSIIAGALPTGLTLNASTGEISGIASSSAIFNFTVEVTDVNSQVDFKELLMTVNPAPVVTTASLLAGTVTGIYNQTLGSSGGTALLTWSISAGTLPSGLSLNASTGVISGTTTTAGTFNFTVQVSDHYAATDTQALSILVNAAPTVTTTTLPNGNLNTFYSQSIATTGGTTPFTWSISTGSLPTGLSLNSSTGVISGTPTVKQTSSFTIQVTDTNGVSDTQALTLRIKQ